MKTYLLLISITFFVVCKSGYSQESTNREQPLSIDKGKFFEVDGRKMLYGGNKDSQHFDITGYSLKDEQFHYGLGRESFPALLKPEFISVKEANQIWEDDSRFLLAYSGGEAKAYAIKDLTRHEVVNDVLDGQPIMAAYCILADLGAIYERNYGNEVLTFAVSGYTYFDKDVWNGLDGFILWDRETESLWWPLTGKAVSGPLKDVKLLEMDKSKWKDVNWKYIKNNHPNTLILKSGQNFERPTDWEKIEDISHIKENYISKN
ncbi:MAG: DUF3179 domain-containing (seleno)protein [Flavobacteriaceae bacterium]